MNISRKNIIIAAIILLLVIVSAGYGIFKNTSSNQIVVETEDPMKKGSTNLTEEDNGVKEGQNADIFFIHVIGAVNNPGLVKIPLGSRISDALQAAGGVKTDADLEMVNIAYKLEDGQQVYIPSKAEVKGIKTSGKNNTKISSNNLKKPVLGTNSTDSSGVKTVSNTAGGVKDDQLNDAISNKGCVNINTAGIAELDTLPGIGPSTAQKIIDYRSISGRFKSTQDIMKVKGIGKTKYEKLKNNISI
ncbi:MAG: helix-hairpin-helix domain-containing protein [Ignavibacteriales bacterium]